MRRRKAEKRDVQPDPIFDDKLITRFVNNLMRDGKKSVARKIFKIFKIFFVETKLKELPENNHPTQIDKKHQKSH